MVVVNVKVKEDQQIQINVQEGKQTFRWLAQVISSRLKQGTRRLSFEEEFCIVTGIRNADGELINPADKIFEHVSEGGDCCNVAADVSLAMFVKSNSLLS